MAVKQTKNSEKKPRGKGKPFTKDDPRINRNGRPPARDAEELNAVIDELLAEEMTNEKGEKIDKLRIALNRLLFSKSPAGAIHILDRRFGKVKEVHELTGKDGKELPAPVIQIYIPKNDRDSSS